MTAHARFETKGSRTNFEILDAAVQVIVQDGLHNITFRAIAEKSGRSRGALLHHFSSREELVRALVAHVFDRRREALERGLRSVTQAELDLEHAGIDVSFAIAREPHAIVLREIQIHARTDEALMDVVKQEAARYNRELTEVSAQFFPEWHTDAARYKLADLFVQVSAQGLALFESTSEGPLDRAGFVALIKDTLTMLKDR